MIDLETLDTDINCVVVSGTFIVFNRHNEEYTEIDTRSYTFSFQSQIEQGRKISESTIRWHFNNPTETFKDGGLSNIATFLTDIKLAISGYKIQEVWSKGVNFDVMILETFDKHLWSYRLPRCFRTVQSLFPDCKEENIMKHNALEDARDQAKELWRITKKHNLN